MEDRRATLTSSYASEHAAPRHINRPVFENGGKLWANDNGAGRKSAKSLMPRRTRGRNMVVR
jgi:hypothetical protein